MVFPVHWLRALAVVVGGACFGFTGASTPALGDGAESSAHAASSGVVTSVAFARAGTSVSAAAPTAVTVPGVPTNVSITENDSAKSATISWAPPTSDGGSPITGYEAARDGTDATGAGPSSTVVAATARSQTFGNLVPGTTYTLSVQAINSVGTGPAASGTVTIPERVQETSLNITYTGWNGVTDPAANGGGYRYNTTTGATARFRFSGTAVTWVTRTGPDRGIATVKIDGVSKGTVDLYAASPASFSKAFTGLASAAHTMVVKVTGTKNPSSSGTGVVVDGFTVGSTTTQETGKAVALNTWTGASSTNASGGQYRVTSAVGATATYTFTGTGVDWVTAIGPAWGKAEVYIDDVDKGTVDLYHSVPYSQFPETYYGLTPGTHTITIKPLGTKNASATSNKVSIDGFGPPTLFHGA